MAGRIHSSMHDDELLQRLSAENAGARIERDASGAISFAPANGGFGGARSGAAFVALATFARIVGGKAFDATQGWKIGPNGAVRSPDASWLSAEHVAAIPLAERRGSAFLAVVPDVAIEVKSPTDDWPALIAKIEEYRACGCGYAIAIDPDTGEVFERGVPPSGLHLDIDAIAEA